MILTFSNIEHAFNTINTQTIQYFIDTIQFTAYWPLRFFRTFYIGLRSGILVPKTYTYKCDYWNYQYIHSYVLKPILGTFTIILLCLSLPSRLHGQVNNILELVQCMYIYTTNTARQRSSSLSAYCDSSKRENACRVHHYNIIYRRIVLLLLFNSTKTPQ